MTAWATLIANSTIAASNIAWDHLNAQGGGSGTVIVGGELSADVVGLIGIDINQATDANINTPNLSAEVVGVSANINTPILEAKICQI